MTVQKDPEQNETKYLIRNAVLTGRSVLEIGCGDGRLTWRYARAARRVIGIDLDWDSLRVASIERASDLVESTTFTQANSTCLPFPNGAFDAAILAWSF